MLHTEQTTGLVEVLVVGPAVKRGKSLLTLRKCQQIHCKHVSVVTHHSTTTAAVNGTVGTGAVPCQSHEQSTVVAEISRPPILRVCEKLVKVLLEALVCGKILANIFWHYGKIGTYSPET